MARGVPAARFKEPSESDGKVTPIRSKKRILSEIDDDQLACRASGQGHDWPKLRPGKPIPKNLRHEKQEDGCYLRVETCRCCGKRRYRYTLPHGVYDRNALYWYEDPKNWKRIPRSAEVSRADMAAEVTERMAPLLFAEESA